jgi:hypothetical protein
VSVCPVDFNKKTPLILYFLGHRCSTHVMGSSPSSRGLSKVPLVNFLVIGLESVKGYEPFAV